MRDREDQTPPTEGPPATREDACIGRENDERLVPLVNIAAQLGMNPRGFWQVANRRGFAPRRLRKGRNAPYFLSSKDAQALINAIERERSLVPQDVPDAAISSGPSGVYAIEAPSGLTQS
jgi:hypothetical protein